MKYVLTILAFLFCGAAQAQEALVVATCGTLPLAYAPGGPRPLTVDTNGRLCGTGGGGGGSPGGSNTQLQYNNAGSFGGITGATTNGTSVTLTSPTFITPALGTPASGVATNLTGTASGLTAGNVTGGAIQPLDFCNDQGARSHEVVAPILRLPPLRIPWPLGIWFCRRELCAASVGTSCHDRVAPCRRSHLAPSVLVVVLWRPALDVHLARSLGPDVGQCDACPVAIHRGHPSFGFPVRS